MVVMNSTYKSAGAFKSEPVTTIVVDLNTYVGKYKMTGLPFPYIEISVKEGKLMMDAGGQVGEIKSTGEPDQFDANGQAKLLFIRDDANKVSKLKMFQLIYEKVFENCALVYRFGHRAAGHIIGGLCL